MAYGDYDGPDKPNKGVEGGACNRSACQAEPALWYNHGSLSWYCEDCRKDIQFDSFNLRDWELNFQPKCGHPMFETREQMNARAADEAAAHKSADRGDRHSQMRDQVERYLRQGFEVEIKNSFYVPDLGGIGKRQRQAPRPRDLYKGKR